MLFPKKTPTCLRVYVPLWTGYWRFNTPDWRGESGQTPRGFTNIHAVPSFDGSAVSLARSQGPSRLHYRETEADGTPNLNLRAGSIRLLYRPNWASVDVMAFPGIALGNVAADKTPPACNENLHFSPRGEAEKARIKILLMP